MRLLTLLTSVALLFTLNPFKPVYAQEANYYGMQPEKINPGSIFFSFKRLEEKILSAIMINNEAKTNYNSKLFRKRLVELIYLADNQKITPIERSTQRFSAQAGILSELLLKNKDADRNQKQIGEFMSSNKILEVLRDKFPANSSNWLLFQQNIDSLNILSEKLRT